MIFMDILLTWIKAPFDVVVVDIRLHSLFQHGGV